jgi:hypothetical protein
MNSARTDSPCPTATPPPRRALLGLGSLGESDADTERFDGPTAAGEAAEQYQNDREQRQDE